MMRRIKNSEVSILSNNCVGGLMCHDVGARFNTPTVNLWMTVPDFLKFSEDLPRYLLAELIEKHDEKEVSPAGVLGGDLTLHFTHYKTFSDAHDAWKRRCGRVNMKKLVLVVSDNSNVEETEIRRFIALPYKKIMFVYSEQKAAMLGDSGFFLRGNFSDGFNASDFDGLSGRRFYHQFDFISWLNQMPSYDSSVVEK